MRLSIGHKLNLAFALTVMLLLAVGVVSFRNTEHLVATADRSSHAHEVLSTVDSAAMLAGEAESAFRGLAATGDERYSRSLDHVARRLGATIARLAALTAGDSVQRRRVETLIPVVYAKLRVLRDGEAAHRLRGPAAAVEVLRAESSRAASDSLREVLRAIAAHERSLLARWAAESHAGADRAILVVRLAMLLTAILAPLAYVVVRNELRVRRRTERALRDSEAVFRAAMDGSLDAFYVLRAVRDDGGRLVDFEFTELNARCEALLGRPREALIGHLLCELLPMNRTHGFFEKYAQVVHTREVLVEEIEITSPDLPAAWVQQQVVPLADGVAITSRDITERKRNEEALRALSLVDELTGMYNRRGFLTLAQQQLKLARRGHRELLLFFVDMDDFKVINDTHGHEAGDIALTRAAAILRRTFRDSDILARIGGDEFVALAADTTWASRETIVTRLRAELAERNERDGYPYTLSFSVGAAHFDPADPPTIEELLATADRMLYEQKRSRPRLRLATA